MDQATCEAFVTSDGRSHVYQLREDWLEAARQRGIPVHDASSYPDKSGKISQRMTSSAGPQQR
jgi:hypothetical protein